MYAEVLVDCIECSCKHYGGLHKVLMQMLRQIWPNMTSNTTPFTVVDGAFVAMRKCTCAAQIWVFLCRLISTGEHTQWHSFILSEWFWLWHSSLFAVWFWLNSTQGAFCLFGRVNLTVVFLCFCRLILLYSICCAGMRDQQLDALGYGTSSTIFECPWQQRQPTGAIASQGAPFWLMPLRGTAHTHEALVYSTDMFQGHNTHRWSTPVINRHIAAVQHTQIMRLCFQLKCFKGFSTHEWGTTLSTHLLQGYSAHRWGTCVYNWHF